MIGGFSSQEDPICEDPYYYKTFFRGVSMDLFGPEVKSWCYILNITGCAPGRKGESGQFFLSFSQFIFHRSTLFECVTFNSP